jgi:hypothetical protein
MLAHLKIIWQFHAHPVHQKVSRLFGPRYIGDDFFLGPNLVSCRSFIRVIVPYEVIWFTYSSDKMSTLDTIVKDYDKNTGLGDCQRQAFEYLHQKLSHDRSLHDHVFWDYF